MSDEPKNGIFLAGVQVCHFNPMCDYNVQYWTDIPLVCLQFSLYEKRKEERRRNSHPE